jgi:hypothetical protein
MLVKIKGLLFSVSQKIKTENGTEIVNLLIKIPDKINEFGEVYQKEIVYQVKAIGNNIGKLPKEILGLTDDKTPVKVEISCFLNSFKQELEGNKIFYNLSLNLYKIDIL